MTSKVCSDQKTFDFCMGLRNRCTGEERLFMDLELKSQEDIDEYFYCYSLNSGTKNEIEGPDYTKYRTQLKPLLKVAAKGFQLDPRLFSCLVFRESGNWRAPNLPQLKPKGQEEVNNIMGSPKGKVLLIRELHQEWVDYLKAHPQAKTVGDSLELKELTNHQIAVNSAALYVKFLTQTIRRSLCQKANTVTQPENGSEAYDACMKKPLSPQYEILAFAAYNWGSGTIEEILTSTRHDLKSILKFLKNNPKNVTDDRRKEMREYLVSLMNCGLRSRWQPQPGSKSTDFRCHDEWSIDITVKPDAGLDD